MYEYTTTGTCASRILFDIYEENGVKKVKDVKFIGGCPGNLLAIGKLVEGADAKKIAELLRGNDCGGRGTSCADQLSLAVEEALRGQ